MYVELKKRVLKKRKQAIKSGIPERFLALADSYINRAIFWRSHEKTKASRSCYRFNRALNELLYAESVFTAQNSNIYSELKTPLLDAELGAENSK